MKVLIAGGGTGGHLMPALAIADALSTERTDLEPVLVGAQRGVDASLLPARKYRYHLLPAEPIYRRRWWKNIKWPLIALRLLKQSRALLDAERPALVLGTGGYASGPVLLAAVLRRIPIALQEQNAMPGLTTRLLARYARQIHLGFPEAARYLKHPPSTEVLAYGNPIRPPPSEDADHADKVKARANLSITSRQSVVFVMGGSQGARRINQVLSEALDANAFEGTVILWSTGPQMWEEYSRHDQPPQTQVKPFWDPISDAYAAADIVVARAGAITTAELCSWGLPSILIPLPSATADHQTQNALALERAGSAIHLPESDLTPELLVERVRRILESEVELDRMGGAACRRGRPEAAKMIAEKLLSLVS